MSEELNRNQFSIGKDCAGLGEVVGHIKELLLFFLNRSSRSLDNEKKSLQNERLGLENAAMLAELAKRVGCSEEEVRFLIGFNLANILRIKQKLGVDHALSNNDDLPANRMPLRLDERDD